VVGGRPSLSHHFRKRCPGKDQEESQDWSNDRKRGFCRCRSGEVLPFSRCERRSLFRGNRGCHPIEPVSRSRDGSALSVELFPLDEHDLTARRGRRDISPEFDLESHVLRGRLGEELPVDVYPRRLFLDHCSIIPVNGHDDIPARIPETCGKRECMGLGGGGGTRRGNPGNCGQVDGTSCPQGITKGGST